MGGRGYESAFVVNVFWYQGDGEWNVNTWQRDDNEWNKGNRVFSPETNHFLPALSAGSFCLQSLVPAINLLAHFV